MGADTATETGWNTVTIGPYVAAAGAILGPPADDGEMEARMHEVVALARKLALTTAQSIPIRTATVKGVLSVASKQNNAHRTQIGIDTGQSQWGEDAMWTDYESAAAAKRTRAVLAHYAGKRVQGTKVTVLEFYADGRPVPGTKPGEQQTRTRLEPGSLFLVDDKGEVIEAIDLTAAVVPGNEEQSQEQRPAATATTGRGSGRAASNGATKAEMVDAAVSFDRLVARLGGEKATEAWGELPRVGQIPRARLQQLAAEHGLADAPPAQAAA